MEFPQAENKTAIPIERKIPFFIVFSLKNLKKDYIFFLLKI
ncbi:hypothetical protein K691_1528 [Campylobacter jejuni HB-CJGB-XWM]|nr:hypothetical protein K691_1528 [Campylobacter jejuni HB-CJGB-XWM]